MSYTENGVLTPADIGAITRNGNGGFGWGGGISDLIALIIVAGLFGFGGYGWGGGYGGGVYPGTNVLTSDFAMLDRKFEGIANGLCDGFYTQAQLINGVNTNIMQGTNTLAAQLADCCCKTQSGIERINTGAAMNTAAITGAIKDCCCENEKSTMQNRFDMAQYNCATLAAIDKLGDRILGYMQDEKAAALRDEVQALRLAESQARQNNAIISALRPMPIPAYPSCNPWAASYGFNQGCNGGTWN